MRLIRPSYEILPSTGSIERDIERAARTCYKSEDKIQEGSAEKMVKFLIERGHTAMLEHGTVYLYLPPQSPVTFYKYRENKYSKFVEIRKEEMQRPTLHKFVTTNYRVLVENGWLDDLKYMCGPTEYHEKRVSVKFYTQIAISREYNRHRVDSVAESSTRYCNYSQDKFDNQITINQPHCITDENLKLSSFSRDSLYHNQILLRQDTIDWLDIDWWLWSINCSELAYMKLLKCGWAAQDARGVLPLNTQTELIHTAFISDWNHFFYLRDDKTHAHPDAYELAHSLHDEFKQLNLL